MLRITIELLPFGSIERRKVLRTAEIVNNGTGTISKGNYDITFYGETGEVYRKTKVTGYQRKQLGPWNLIQEAIKSLDRRND